MINLLNRYCVFLGVKLEANLKWQSKSTELRYFQKLSNTKNWNEYYKNRLKSEFKQIATYKDASGGYVVVLMSLNGGKCRRLSEDLCCICGTIKACRKVEQEHGYWIREHGNYDGFLFYFSKLLKDFSTKKSKRE